MGWQAQAKDQVVQPAQEAAEIQERVPRTPYRRPAGQYRGRPRSMFSLDVSDHVQVDAAELGPPEGGERCANWRRISYHDTNSLETSEAMSVIYTGFHR